MIADRLLGYLGALAGRRPEAPRMLTYAVTYTCNARCVMCDSWRIPSRDDLSLDEIERIFASLPRLDVVRLTGGEPFVRRDLGEIAELVRRHLNPLFLHITTNGFTPERVVNFCEQRDQRLPLHLLVSVDGVGEKHDAVRRREGAWERTLETLRALAPRKRELNLALSVNQVVVDREGIDHIGLLRQELEPLGVRNNVILAYDESATYSVERDRELRPSEVGHYPTYGHFDRADLQRFLEEAEVDLARYNLPERMARRYYLDGLRNRLLDSEGTPSPRCAALRRHLRIYPNGDVPTCQFNSTIVGNLREQAFRELWSSKQVEEKRAWVDACPGCWAECEVLPSAAYSGDLLRHFARRPRRAPHTELTPSAGVAS